MPMFTDRRLLCITLIVIFGHMVGVAWIEWFSFPLSFESKKEKLLVKTVALAPPVKKEIKNVPQKKKTVPSTPTQKKSDPVKHTMTKKKNQPSKQKSVQPDSKRNLLAQARKHLQNINKNASTIDDVAVIHSMQIDSLESTTQDQKYYSELANCLRQSLRLPDRGDVKIKLSLDCKGSVVRVRIVQSQNENNSRYVEKLLPTVVFPPFGRSLTHEKEHTFTITLTNDF